MYVCGITPYDATHLGHAFTYLMFDLVKRVWIDLGIKVQYTQNVTDVDDPLLERATDIGWDWQQLAQTEVEQYCLDMAALRIMPPDHFLSVSASMPCIEDYLAKLQAAGVIYQIQDEFPDWYFSIESQPSFGAVFGLPLDQMMVTFAERGGDPFRAGKRHPLDALVWRQARFGEPSWPSSFGQGRPGWHIECNAIAQASLGSDIDLQGGGSDLIFPHHEVCAAQAQAATGHKLANTFVHTGMVCLDGAKMSKSEGNLVKIAELVESGIDPMAIRLALLAHHYRNDWNWTSAGLNQAQARLDLWRRACRGSTSLDCSAVAAQVRAYLRDDLHAERALVSIDSWALASLAVANDYPGSRQQMVALSDRLLGVALI